MRTGNLIVFGPGFRQVWKFKFDAVPLIVLGFALALAVIVMSTAGIVAPLLTADTTENSSRLFVENGTLASENRAAQNKLQQLAERARKLTEQTSRLEAELAE
jgi:hypothetical protein